MTLFSGCPLLAKRLVTKRARLTSSAACPGLVVTRALKTIPVVSTDDDVDVEIETGRSGSWGSKLYAEHLLTCSRSSMRARSREAAGGNHDGMHIAHAAHRRSPPFTRLSVTLIVARPAIVRATTRTGAIGVPAAVKTAGGAR